jgi:hypothetical protein
MTYDRMRQPNQRSPVPGGRDILPGWSPGRLTERRPATEPPGADSKEHTQGYGLVSDVVERPGEILDSRVRASLEPRFARDFSHVRVHTDDEAAQSADAVGAATYTFAHHIVFGRGRFNPISATGLSLVAHELTHVPRQPMATTPHARAIADGSSTQEVQAGQAALWLGTHTNVPEPTPGIIYRQPSGIAAPVAVGSFRPTAKSLTVDRTGSSMHISGTLVAYGDEASAANAAAAEATIRVYWNQTFPDGFVVTCDVSVVFVPRGTPLPSGTSQIEMAKTLQDSHVNSLTGNMTLNMKDSDALTWVVAHEFGHMIGVRDRYTEGIMSRVGGLVGATRSATVDPGYQGTIMGETGGTTTSATVRDIGEENKPSFLTDDDQIRLWVLRHKAIEIGALSTATKIQMINTLLDGWISDDDVRTIESICDAIKSKIESTQVKQALEARLLTITDLGQRTRVRAVILKLP